MVGLVIAIKLLYQWLYGLGEREYPEVVSWLKTPRASSNKVKRSDLLSLNIGDVIPTDYGYDLAVEGKTGRRVVPIIDAAPLLS